MKQLSVIIVTYHSEEDIYDCLDSLWQHCDIPLQDVEVIIVENSSECEPMFSKLRELYGDDIVLIRNTHNGGYGQGNNVGIRQATAPVVLIMNPDVRLISPFFKKPLESFQKDDTLIMYGMKQMLTSTAPSHTSFMFTTMMNGYMHTLLTGLCNRMDWYWPRWMYLAGSCFFVRKSMFEAIGLFDENVFMYGEEDDIHYRLLQKFGNRFHYDSDIRYIHLTQGRPPSLSYEKKLLEMDLYLHDKKGWPAKKTLRTYLQINNVLLSRCYLRKLFGGCNEESLTVLKALRKEIKTLQKEYGKK